MFTHGGRNNSSIDALKYAKQMEDSGAGELLVTSMDKDGTKSGYDIELMKKITSNVNIPVIASRLWKRYFFSWRSGHVDLRRRRRRVVGRLLDHRRLRSPGRGRRRRCRGCRGGRGGLLGRRAPTPRSGARLRGGGRRPRSLGLGRRPRLPNVCLQPF